MFCLFLSGRFTQVLLYIYDTGILGSVPSYVVGTIWKHLDETVRRFKLVPSSYRGGFWISRKGVHMYKGAGVRFADFILFFLNTP